MGKIEGLIRRVRFRYRRSSLLLKCVVLAAIVLSVAALVTLGFLLKDTRGQTDDLRRQAAALEQENRDLEQQIAQLGSVQSIRRIATERLDLVDPETHFFTPETIEP